MIPPAVDTELNPEMRNMPGIAEIMKKRCMSLEDFNQQAMEKLRKGELEFGVGTSHDAISATQNAYMQKLEMMNGGFKTSSASK